VLLAGFLTGRVFGGYHKAKSQDVSFPAAAAQWSELSLLMKHNSTTTEYTEELIEAARSGRIAAQSPETQFRRADMQRRHVAALKAWDPSSKPAWLNEKTYREEIQPRLAGVTVPTISSALSISEPYATDIRAGRRLSHPRHWLTLARLVGVGPDE
jgi:hypothetical protein